MRIDTEGTSKLSFFQDLYREARSATEELHNSLVKHMEQYKGSNKIVGANGEEAEALHVRNVTYELIESQVTGYIPNPSVSPKMWSEKNERGAKAIETLLRNKRNELPFEKHNDMDERFTPIYGGSVWLIEWDESIVTHNSVGDIKVTCLSPSRFTGQPNIYEISDMEYCFIQFETTKEDIVRKYNVSLEIADEAESDENADDKTATLYVCYYKNDEGKICQYIWSGETELLDIDDYYARKVYVCKKCGKRREICTCEGNKDSDYELKSQDYEELERDIALADGTVIPAESEVVEDGQVVMQSQRRQATEADGSPAFEYDVNNYPVPLMVDIEVPKVEPTRLPYYRPSVFPVVIRKNTSQEDSLLGQSDCEFIRPQQQAINKVESRIIKKVMSSGVYPIVPKEFDMELDNSLFEKVFRADTSTYNLYGRVDLAVNVGQDVSEAERLYDQAKRILGISASFQGQYDSSAQSGKAKQLQIQQAAGRLNSKRQMKNAAYAEIDKIIFQYYLAYADEPRPAAYKDAFGTMQNTMFNRYDFIERDETGEYYYNDEFLFSCDASADLDSSREMLWQENRQNFAGGAYGDPKMPQTQLIFWLNMERAHYPFARDNVERLREEIRRQQQLEQQQEQIAALQQENSKHQEYEGYLQGEIDKHAKYESYLQNIIDGGKA